MNDRIELNATYPADVQDWQRRSRLELEVIIRKVLWRRDPSRQTGDDFNDLLRLLKDEGIERKRLAADNPNPDGGGPWRRSRVTCQNLRAFATAIAHRELLEFCEIWEQGRPAWDAATSLDAGVNASAQAEGDDPAPEVLVDRRRWQKGTLHLLEYLVKEYVEGRLDMEEPRTTTIERIETRWMKICDEKKIPPAERQLPGDRRFNDVINDARDMARTILDGREPLQAHG